MNRLKTFFSKVAAIGAVRRNGIGALQAYGGKVEGEGTVTHNSGPRKGQVTKFKLQGQPGTRRK